MRASPKRPARSSATSVSTLWCEFSTSSSESSSNLEPDEIIAKRGRWELKLALAFDLAIADQREWLPPRQDGYVVRLVVGADDGAAHNYDIDRDGTAPGAAAPLSSVEIAVREVRSGSS